MAEENHLRLAKIINEIIAISQPMANESGWRWLAAIAGANVIGAEEKRGNENQCM
jgi:hypothetical protein